MKKKKHSKHDSLLKQVICVFLSFILTISLTVTALFICFKAGYIGLTPVTNALNKCNYYQLRYNAFIDTAKNEAIALGVSEDIYGDLFSLENYKSDCNDYFTALSENKRYEYNDSEMVAVLEQKIRDYVAEHNLNTEGDVDTIISNFTSTVSDSYTATIRFPYFVNLVALFESFDRIFIILTPVMAIFAVILMVFLYRLNKYKKNRACRYIAYGFLSTALSILILPIVSYQTNFYKKINISPEYMYNSIVSYVGNGLQIFMAVGIISAIIGILLIVASVIIKNKLKQEIVSVKHHHHHHDESKKDSDSSDDDEVEVYEVDF